MGMVELRGKKCTSGYEEGTRGKCDWFQYCGTKKTFSQGLKTEGTEPIKSLASGELPGIDVSLSCSNIFTSFPSIDFV